MPSDINVGGSRTPQFINTGVGLDGGSGHIAIDPGTHVSDNTQVLPGRDVRTDALLGVGTRSPEVKEYDYVFVGGGATGGAAARDLLALFDRADELKRQGFSVCILESGVDQPTHREQIPASHAITSEDKKVLANPDKKADGGTGYWVQHFSKMIDMIRDPKATLGRIWKPRGEGWGGSTRMNAMVFNRVDDVDWNKIAIATGDPSFRAENMKHLFDELAKPNYK